MYENINVRVGADISQFISALSRATMELEGFSKKLADVGKSTRVASDAMEETTKKTQSLTDIIKKNSEALEQVGKVGKIVTAGSIAMAGGLGFASKSAVDFESAFAGVRKTVDATEEEFAVLERGIRDMAKELPASAVEIAAVAEAAGQLGIAQEDVLQFTRVMIDLGESTNMSADVAATSLARFANIVQMPMKNIDRLGATIVALGNNLATTEAEIVEMGLRLAGAGHQIGLTEAQILSFAGALSSVGIEAEAGGTAFSRVMIEMSNAVQIGGDGLKMFAKVAGMSAGEFKKAFKEDAAGALITFIEGLARVSKEGGNVFAVLEELGLSEIRVRDTLLRASGAGNLFRESVELGSEAWKENTALTDEAAERYKTLESRLSMLKNTFADAAISIGTALMPAIEALTSGLKWLVERFNALPEPVKAVIAVLMALSTGFGLLLGPMLIFIGMLPSIVKGMALLKGVLALVKGTAIATVAPIAAVITVVAGLAGGLVYLYRTSEEFRGAIDGVVSRVKGGLNVVLGKAAKIASKLTTTIGQKLSPVIETLGEKISSLLDSAKKLFSGGKESMQGFTEILQNFGPSVVAVLIGGIPGVIISAARYLPAIAEELDKNMPTVLETIVKTVNMIMTAFSDALPKIVEVGIGVIQKLIEGLNKALPTILYAVITIITTLISMFAENAAMIIELGVNILITLIEGIVMAIPMIVEAAILIITTLIETIATMLPEIVNAGIEVIFALIDGIIPLLPEIAEAAIMIIITLIGAIIANLPKIIEAGIKVLLTLIEGIVQTLPQLIQLAVRLIIALVKALIENLPKIIKAGGQLLLALIDGVLTLIGSLGKLGLQLVVALAEAIIGAVPKLTDAGKQLIKGLWNGIKNAKNWIKNKISGLVGDITGWFKSKFGIASPSKLFRDEIGKMLPLGMVDGIYRMKRDVVKATEALTEWATPDVPDVAFAYSTPTGTFSPVSSAIHGTIDVNTRDEVLVQEIRNLRRAMHGMRVVMDGREVGWLVEPHVTERQEFKTNINRSFRG